MIENVNITDSLGNPIPLVFSLPEGTSSIVVISHGYSSNKDSRIYRELQDELNSEGMGTLRYDYYGHGPAYGFKGPEYGVLGDLTLSKTVESLKATLGYIRERGNFDIGLLGSSFGGLISQILSSQDQDIKALALKSPVTEPIGFWKQRILRDFGKGGFEEWGRNGTMHYRDGVEDYDLSWEFWTDLQRYDTLGDARNIICPTLIVHGENDTYVPISQSQELAEVLGVKVNVIQGADHGYAEPEQHNEVKGLIRDFLAETLIH
jgi:pimeloyl-ACP methyl ester carboxylesterase